MMSMRRASSSLPMTSMAGLPAFLSRLGALELPLARGVEVADITEGDRPVAGDPGEVRPACREPSPPASAAARAWVAACS